MADRAVVHSARVRQVLAAADVWLDLRGSSSEGPALDLLAEALLLWRAFHAQHTHATDTDTRP